MFCGCAINKLLTHSLRLKYIQVAGWQCACRHVCWCRVVVCCHHWSRIAAVYDFYLWTVGL